MFLKVVLVSAKLDHYLGRFIKERHFEHAAPVRRKSHLSQFGSQQVKLVSKVGSQKLLVGINESCLTDRLVNKK